MSCFFTPFFSSQHLIFSPNKTRSRNRTGTGLKSRPTSRLSLDSRPPSNPVSLLTNIGKFLWGPSLPPGLLISTVRGAWNSTWQLMMSQLAPSDSSGNYTRPASKFALRNPTTVITSNLHLYVGLPCPWAHRTLIVRALKGLEDSVPLSIASPGEDGSWEFKNVANSNSNKNVLVSDLDKANGCKNLKEVYGLRKGGYNGRATVPMLWDMKNKEVICNESYDIIQFFNSGLNGLARNQVLDLEPEESRRKIEEWNKVIYSNVNNGVYRCGFSQSQEAYDTAVYDLFSTLDMIDEHLSGSRYLCGDEMTLADVCLFTTLIRFDSVYNVLFKCAKKKLIEYHHLYGYMQDIYQIPKVAETCNFTAIMEGYYKILFPLNPGGIRPIMPSSSGHQVLSRPHKRGSMSSFTLKE